jgi:acetyl-CoA acetyltransferase
MRDVAIIGAGMTPCRSRWLEKSFWELAQMAVSEAVRDAGIHIQEVEAGVAGIYNDIFEFQAIPESGLQGIIGLANKNKPELETITRLDRVPGSLRRDRLPTAAKGD